MRNIEVVVAPELTPNYNSTGKLVVVIDVFRATTTIVTAMANGVAKVKTCLNTKEAIDLKEQGYLVGGERNGIMVAGMEVDNSPLSFLNQKHKGCKLAISTTNGTKAVEFSKHAREMIIGAFTNISAVVNYIINSELDVLLVCAGWKGKMSIEDFMFSGAVIHNVIHCFSLTDSADIALSYFLKYKESMIEKLTNCEHANRLKMLKKQLDINFCLTQDLYKVLPKYNHSTNFFEL